jgi:hypothetical protein
VGCLTKIYVPPHKWKISYSSLQFIFQWDVVSK